MEAIMLGINIILMGVSVFFAYRYFSLKHHLHIHKEIINGMEELSAGKIAAKVDERSSKHAVFNGLIDYFGLVREKFFPIQKMFMKKVKILLKSVNMLLKKRILLERQLMR
ncbi:hypothetical protein M5V91_20590 [Cytobacillus pseudoceanisediminis]|uniref:hypothetical protein n=1 Tax=Cytobacillus pseudoceanisediminis TaxID=3051614 RepID=UPI00218A8EB9|nr:hypothetical protein [Cytobacillus pseudoceanisediminis]UQX53238.1 hypothetical protein M5V91_20590 [Cytobacillus pseudoceanisediminis]